VRADDDGCTWTGSIAHDAKHLTTDQPNQKATHMLIIFAIRSFAKTLAMLTRVCRRCHHLAAHRLVQRSRWFTLFFILLVPLGFTRYTVCAFCGVGEKVSRADAQQLMRTARQATAAAMPAGTRAPFEPLTHQPHVVQR
jgi:hypothetical protein